MAKNKKITIDVLAGIVKKGFDEVAVNLDLVKKELKQDIGEVRRKVEGIEEDVGDIKLRMGNVAWNFETRELDKRVTKLERKANIK